MIFLISVSICLVTLNCYKLEDARHLSANDCYDQCPDSKDIDNINFDTTNRGRGQWFFEDGIWKRRRPTQDGTRKRINFDRRLDPDAGIDPLDRFGI